MNAIIFILVAQALTILALAIALIAIRIMENGKRGKNYFAPASEDISAILLELIIREQAEQEYRLTRLRNIDAIAKATRQRKYDRNAPNGRNDAEKAVQVLIEFLENRMKEGE